MLLIANSLPTNTDAAFTAFKRWVWHSANLLAPHMKVMTFKTYALDVSSKVLSLPGAWLTFQLSVQSNPTLVTVASTCYTFCIAYGAIWKPLFLLFLWVYFSAAC